MKDGEITFNWPYMTGRELYYIADAHFKGRLAGDGPYTSFCHRWLEEKTCSHKALLTHSCTAALEMAALLLDIQPGDEVIMPSYTFVSTANAFVLRGGIPVFVDIRRDTLNIDETLIENAVTPKTKAIVPVHYAGVACEMDTLMDIANRQGIMVVEDAAQGVMASYKGRALGSIGDLGCYSFHETKNIISGEGGALLINDSNLATRAEIIREKGTDRSRFFRGEVDKYTWQDMGSSYLPGELIAAFLWAQMEEAEEITKKRMATWQMYHSLLEPLEKKGLLRRPVIPDGCEHNGHMYYIILSTEKERNVLMTYLQDNRCHALFHYIPLHSSPGGKRYGKTFSSLCVTDSLSERLLRLPLYTNMAKDDTERVVSRINLFYQ